MFEFRHFSADNSHVTMFLTSSSVTCSTSLCTS